MSTRKTSRVEPISHTLDDYIQEALCRRIEEGHCLTDIEIELAARNDEPFMQGPRVAAGLIGSREADSPTDNMALAKYGQGGFDTVEGGLFGVWDEARYAALLEELERAKALSQGGELSTIHLGGVEWCVRPQGFRAGVFYQYVLEAHGVMIALPAKVNKQYAAVRYRLGFHVLIGRDMYAVFAELLSLLKGEGFVYRKDTVSRVDIEVDMVGVPFAEFLSPVLNDQAVMRARNFSLHGRVGNPETVMVGSTTQLCIYDKLRELLKGGDEVKLDLMIQHRFGGRLPKACTRVEFRVKRDALRNLGIENVEDFQKKERCLLEFLHTDWFRILEAPKQRGHENEQGIHPLWKEVQAAFAESFNQPRDEEVNRSWKKRRQVKCDAEQLAKQAAGCLATRAALQGRSNTLEQTGQSLFNYMGDTAYDIWQRAMQKAKELGIIRGVKFDRRRRLEGYFNGLEASG